MATTATQLSLQVPKQLDHDLREFLTSETGSASQADIAAFVEDAVRNRIFEMTCQRVKARNAHLDQQLIEDVVDEALQWARQK